MPQLPAFLAKLIDEVIEREGGYSHHPADRGGPTRWGVTEAVARADGYTGAMTAFPREQAVAIYTRTYWTRPQFDLVASRAPLIAAELFDTGINMGPAVAIGFLQRALNALNRGAEDYPDLQPDGRIGPATLAALDGFLKVRGARGEGVLLKAIEALQGERYIALAERRPANEAFLYGWLANRIGAFVAFLAPLFLLAGCATTAAAPVAPVPSSVAVRAAAVDRLTRLNTVAQGAVALFLPWLSPERAARVRQAAAAVDAAIARVAAARDLAAQAAAEAEATTAIAEYKWLAGS